MPRAPMSIEDLYPRVTEAIERAQALEDAGDADAARVAYREVSTIEAAIAAELPPRTTGGDVARCGAVNAARKSGDEARARELARRYLDEDLPPKTREYLLEMLAPVR